MKWLDKIRSKPEEERIKIIKIVLITTGTLLLILWISTTKITKGLPADLTVFQTLGRGFKDFKSNISK
jgi:hypothetical protein